MGYTYRSTQGLHKREAEPSYAPALAYHPAGGYGYNKYGPGYSYVDRSPQGLHKRRPLAPATRPLSVLTATATTAKTPSTTSRSPATTVTSMRGAMATTSPSTTDSTFKRFRAMQMEHENVLVTLCYAYCSLAPSSKPNHNY